MGKSLKLLTMLAVLASTTACMSEKQESLTDVSSTSAALATRSEISVGQTYYVNTNGLNVRASDDNGRVLGLLARNDAVKVIASSDALKNDYVEVEIVETASEIATAEKYFVSFKYLESEKFSYKKFTGKYFVIQNVATEKLRVYERVCVDNTCPNKMIMETNMVVGEQNKGREEMTWLGSFRITGWSKFHEDGKGLYPRWFDPSYPEIPEPGKGFTSWFKNKHMPEVNGEKPGVMRGAFGWYTALVGPNAFAQWTHGTVGWGADKDKFILNAKKFVPNLVTAPRSHGCSRTDNEAIGFLREHLPIGTPIIKIYAIEDIADKSLSNYTTQKGRFDYILTKDKNLSPGRETVLKTLVNSADVIEEGTYFFDQTPDVQEYTPGEDLRRFERKIGNKGNIYGVDSTNMFGVFYIDLGLVSGYQHPQGLDVGGYEDELVPDFMNLDQLDL